MSRHLLLICNSRSASLSVHELDLDGATVTLRREIALPVPKGENSASPMAFNVSKERLYLPWRGARKHLMSFAFDVQAAALELTDTLPFDHDICYLGLDRAGRNLLAAGDDKAMVLPLGPDGRVRNSWYSTLVGPMAHCIADTGRGQVLATSCRGDLVRRFDYNPMAGTLSKPLDLAQPCRSGPRHLCISADGGYAYLLSQEGGEVVVIALGRKPLERQRLPLVRDGGEGFGPMGGDIGLTPDGRFLYASERSANRLVGFRVGDDGLLTPSGGVGVSDYPRAFTIDPGGRFLTVVGFRGHRAEVFAIAENGALVPVVSFDTGERPSWVLSIQCP